jgi:2'-5' RNA ligase
VSPEPASAGRLFLAVPLGPAVRSAVGRYLESATGGGALPGRPVRPEGWHLTLRFLGDTPAEVASRLRAGLLAADLGPAFSLRLSGLGAFPSPSRARVLWLGVEDGPGADALAALAERVEAVVESAGLPADDRPFRGHLTLSRLVPPEDVRPLVAEAGVAALAVAVEAVVLYRSHLGRGPARYEVAERFPLARPGGPPPPSSPSRETIR